MAVVNHHGEGGGGIISRYAQQQYIHSSISQHSHDVAPTSLTLYMDPFHLSVQPSLLSYEHTYLQLC